MSWDCMISLARLDVCKVLTYSNRKSSFSTAHVLFFAGTCYEIHYILSGTGSEMFHRVCPLCNRRLEVLSFTSPVSIKETYPAFPAWKKAFTVLKEWNISRWVNDIRSNLSLDGSGSPEDNSCLFRNNKSQKSIISKDPPSVFWRYCKFVLLGQNRW